MEVVSEAEQKEHLKIIESLKRETEQLKKAVEILRASTRFAIDNIRDMQGKENMTTTMQKIAEAKKLKVVSTESMVEKIELERKHNKKLQKEPIMNSVHFLIQRANKFFFGLKISTTAFFLSTPIL